MNVYLYSLFAYGLTAVISLGVIGIIVVLTRLIGKDDASEETT